MAQSNNAYSNVDNELWTTYAKYRPRYPDSLFQRIYAYHTSNGGSFDGSAHDAGCGPGITAGFLASKFNHIICSDFSESAIGAAREHLLSSGAKRGTSFDFRVSAAENMSWIAENSLDMVTMSEALHWTDSTQTLREAHRVLKKGGTFAAFYYTQPRLPDNDDANVVFRDMQANWCKLRRDFSPESERTLWVEQSGYDCIAFPQEQWSCHRIKINTNGDDDVWVRDDDLYHMRHKSRLREHEVVEYVENDPDWQQEVDVDWFRGWFMSMSPQVDDFYLSSMLDRLEASMQPGRSTRIVWPVVILLASKR